MATIISSKTSGVGGLTVTGDASGVLQLASADGTTAVTIDASQNVTFAKGLTVGATAAPAFSATLGSQSLTAGVWTLASLSTEEFDTNSNYNNTGSTVGGIPAYAFLPNIAGYYQFNGQMQLNGSSSGISTAYYKNGSFFKQGSYIPTTLSTASVAVSALIYLNGTTDYVQFYIYSGSTTTTNNAFFQAAMIRSA